MPPPPGTARGQPPKGARPFAIIAFTSVILVLGALWLARVPVAEWTISGLAFAAGYDPIRLKVETVGFDRIRATDVNYGEAMHADAVEMEFTLDGIFAGKIARLDADGLRLTLQFGPNGVALAGVSSARTSSKPSPLPFDTMQLRGVDAALKSPAGDAAWRGNIRLQPAEGGGHSVTLVGVLATPRGDAPLDAVGTVTSDPALGRGLSLAISAGSQTPGVGFGLTGRMQALWADRALGARFAFERAWAAAGDNRLDGMKGDIELSTGQNGIQRLAIKASYDSIGAEGIALAPGRIVLSYEAGALDAMVELGWGKSRGRINAHGRIDDPDAPLLLDGEAALLAGDAIALAGVDGEAGGRIEFRIAAALSDPRELLATPTARAALDRLRGRIDLAVGIEHASLAQLGSGLDLTGRMIGQIDEHGLRLEISEGLIVTAETLSDTVLNLFPARLRSAFSGPQALALGGTQARPTIITWLRDGDAYELAASGTARLRGQFADLKADATARLTLDAALEPQAIDIADASLVVTELWMDPAEVAAELHVSGFSGPANGAHGQMTVEGMLVGWAESGFSLDDASVALDGELTWRQGRVEFAPASGGRIALRGIGWEDRLYLPDPLELTLAVGANAFSFLTTDDGFRYVISLAPFNFSGLAIMPDGKPARIDLTVPVASVHGEGSGDHSLMLRAARLEAPRPELRVTGVDLDLDWNAKAGRIVFAAKELRDTAAAPLLAPLSLRAEAFLNDGRLSYTAQFTTAQGRAAGNADGIVEIASGRGETRFRIDPVRFQADGLQPVDVFPSYGGVLADVAGAMDLAGGVNWGGGGKFETRARLTVHDLSLSTGGVRVSELNGPIELTAFTPLATAEAQQLHGILSLGGRRQAGFDVTFQLPKSGFPEVERLSVDLADGKLMAEPFTLDPKNLSVDAALLDLDLAELAERLGVDGLLTNARLSGHATFRLDAAGFSVTEGELSSVAPGFLHYGGQAIATQYRNQPETVAKMMQALDNFDFDGLTLSLEKPRDGTGRLHAQLSGVNRAVLDGQAFELELVLRSDYAPLASVATSLHAAAVAFVAWPRAAAAH